MKIKTAQEILIENHSTIKAMKLYAEQFIDLAAHNIWHQSHMTEKNYNKQVVIDVKEFIK